MAAQSPVPASKKAARMAARTALRDLGAPGRATASIAICQHLAGVVSPAAVVLCFAPLPLEPDLLSLLTQHPDSRFLFPLVTGPGTMTLHHVTRPGQLAAHRSPIPEPDPDRSPAVPPSEVTLALVPALAFDPATGRRLGHGGGFYDRLLASPDFTARAVGVAFACQLRILFPVEPHDQPVSSIVTEQGLDTPVQV